MIKRVEKELFLYLIMGGLTTLINICVFFLVHTVAMRGTLMSVIIANIVALLFAYVSNKYWVFNSRSKTNKATIIEALAFFGVRCFSLVIDIAATFICIHLGVTAVLAKIIANIVVIVVNYVTSKWWVFKK